MRLLVWLSVLQCFVAGVLADGMVVAPPPVVTRPSTASPSPRCSSSPAEQAAVSVYLVASEIAAQFHDRVLSPAIQLWKEQEAAALERKWNAKHQQQQVSSPILATAESSSDNGPTHIVTSTNVKKPANNVLGALMADVEEPRHNNQIVTTMLSPRRFGKVTVVAWLVAEALDRLGILQEDTPQILQSQLQRVGYLVTTGLREVQYRFETAAAQSNKPPFAVGMMAGMLVSPILTMAWKPLVAVVCLAEWNFHQRMQGKWHLTAPRVGDCLETIRYHVRSTFLLPYHRKDEEQPTLMITSRKTGGTPKKSHDTGRAQRTLTFASTTRGRFSRPSVRNHSRSKEGIKSRSTVTGSKGQYQGQTHLLVQSKRQGFQPQSPRRDQGRRLLLIKSGGGGNRNHNYRPKRVWWVWKARKDPKEALSPTIITNPVEQRDRLRDLVRHGAVVGGLLGFMGGL